MDSSQLLGITTFTFLFASFLYIAALVFRTENMGKAATGFTIIALLILTLGLGLRWIESYQLGIGHAPLTNMYESVVFFAWTIIIFYLGIEWKFKTRTIGAFALPLAFLAMAYASFAPINRGINPLVPALQSNWLLAHVITCFVGYAAFAIAAALGIMYLAKTSFAGKSSVDQSKELLPPLAMLEDITHKSMIFGFIWLSAGIITGAIWANSAWGTYWSWDPKETWSLITWFVYAFALHARYTRGIKGKTVAWLSLVGFIAVIFTYYGVNFLLSGLHSYGSS
ncbi:MAG: c-type cytochrome biogenesis protein CcsB [Desulfocapsaceae bacterium]|jgi:cytochrome c-type biogenesis protein CcsB|nr:c-type cytochrome biogenesis protein CcsB [Desulfocapsaceae bacterium]